FLFFDMFLPGSRARFRLFFLAEVLVGVAHRGAVLFSHLGLSFWPPSSAPQSKKSSRSGGPEQGSQTGALPVHPWSKRHGRRRLGRDEILGRGLAGPAVGYDLIRDLLPFVEAVHSGPLNGADVNEHIAATVIRLNEAEALLAVEPLHGSD